MAFARRTWLFTLGLWLSLAMVLGHALAPVGSPVVRKSGSAFSTATYEVSLGPARAGIAAKLKRFQIADDEDGGGPDLPALLLAAAPVPPAPAAPAIPIPASGFVPAAFGPGDAFRARAPPAA